MMNALPRRDWMTHFTERRRLSEGTIIVVRVLIIFLAVTVASKNDDTVYLRLKPWSATLT